MNDVIRIATAAIRMMSGGKEDPELVLLTLPGSSGSRVVIFRNAHTGHFYAVKCASEPRVSMKKEATNRDSLAHFMPNRVPSVLWEGEIEGRSVLVSECAGLGTLHSLILNGDVPLDELSAVWSEFLTELRVMWRVSRCGGFDEGAAPRPYVARLERVKNGVLGCRIGSVNLSGCWTMPILVNGAQCPSLAESFASLARMGAPSYSVTCHGDPQPNNIVVGSEGWKCIDWEWSGPGHDWRMLASHLYGWWPSRCQVLLSSAHAEVRSGQLIINFDAELPSHLHPFQRLSEKAIRAEATDANEARWTADVNRYLATLYFGETRFLNIWGRAAFAAVQIGQASLTMAEVLNPSNGPSTALFMRKEATNV